VRRRSSPHARPGCATEVPAVGDLDRIGRAGARALGVGAGAASTDHLGAGMSEQPRGERVGLPIGKQIDRPMGGDVDQHDAVDVPASEREIVHPSTVTVPISGSGNARNNRNSVLWLVGKPSGTVAAYLAPFRALDAAPPPKPAVPKVRPIASWLLRHPDERDDEEQLQLKQVLAACPHLQDTATHVAAFGEMLTGRYGDR
jgi:hypothetical protein